MTKTLITASRLKPWLAPPALLGFAILAGGAPAAAPAAEPPPSASEEWSTPIPCDERHSRPLPGQPAIGLALFRFDCPGLPSRLVSAKRSALLPAFVSTDDIPRGSSPRQSSVQKGADVAVHRLGDAPLGGDGMERMRARRLIAAGEPLLLKDFEPKKLWIGGDAIVLKIVNGNVAATLPARALGVGRHGEPATARTDAGKVFSGTATEDDDGPPVLLVGPARR